MRYHSDQNHRITIKITKYIILLYTDFKHVSSSVLISILHQMQWNSHCKLYIMDHFTKQIHIFTVDIVVFISCNQLRSFNELGMINYEHNKISNIYFMDLIDIFNVI